MSTALMSLDLVLLHHPKNLACKQMVRYYNKDRLQVIINLLQCPIERCTMNHNNHINALNTWYILTWRLVDSIPQHERSCWWGRIFIAHQGPTPFPWTFKWLSIFMESKRKRNRIEFSPYKLNLLERWPIVSLSERVYFTCFCCFCFFYQASCNCWWNSLYNDDNDDNYFEVDIMWLLMIPNWKLTLTDRMSIATTTRTGKNVSSTKTKKASS